MSLPNKLSLAVLLVLGVAGCDSQTQPAEKKSVAGSTAPVPPTAPVATSEASPETCTDWSKADLGDLPPLPESRHAELLEEVWRRVLEQYYDPTLGCVDWVEVRGRYGEKLAKAKDSDEAFATINGMLGELEQSHFRLFSSGADDVAGPASPRAQIRWIEEQLVVVHGAALPSGAKLRAIEGVPVSGLIATAKERSTTELEFPSTVGRLAAARLSCQHVGDERTVTIELAGKPDAPVDRTVTCEAPEGKRLSLGNLSDIPTRVEARKIDGTKVGYLAFNVWMLPMVATIRAELAALRSAGIEALVLDLRGNPGGVGPMAVPVARMLLDKPGSLGVLRMRAFTQEFHVDVAKDHFSGPVALLVDEGTASTSEIFAAGMRELERVTIVGGRPSAGAALPSLIEELSGGALLQYVVGDYHSPKGTEIEGRGVIPDITVAETRSAFAAGRDPVLDAAVKHLQETAP